MKRYFDLGGGHVLQLREAMVKRVQRLAIGVGAAILGGGLSFWAVMPPSEAQRFERLEPLAVCALELPAGVPSVTAEFSTTRSIPMFHVGLRVSGPPAPISITISGESGLVANVAFEKAAPFFGLGNQVPPGDYTVTLHQGSGGQGVSLVMASEKSVFTTGWQIWYRTYLALFFLSGVWVVVTRGSAHWKRRAVSIYIFRILLLGFTLIFLYLLFHEGGHALAQIYFGRFDLAESDFWGIHGHPHSGGTGAQGLEPWQQVLISCAGPMFPTLVGFALFILWASLRRSRGRRPVWNLYFTAIIAMLVFPDTVLLPFYLLGLLKAEGDLIGFVIRTGGPVWLFRGLLLAVSLLGGLILWKLVPEIRRELKALMGTMVAGGPNGLHLSCTDCGVDMRETGARSIQQRPPQTPGRPKT